MPFRCITMICQTSHNIRGLAIGVAGVLAEHSGLLRMPERQTYSPFMAFALPTCCPAQATSAQKPSRVRVFSARHVLQVHCRDDPWGALGAPHHRAPPGGEEGPALSADGETRRERESWSCTLEKEEQLMAQILLKKLVPAGAVE